ncbi:uncharacterized protein LACBIDRAFT_301973 [Laccaria bicolor S238N-H82]|uniref:Predicted protein n=1 Tax=Laccaria bicolor (strain S238N-H82 / ATCC MYA-4686) TaxID=486041 RepID=B0CQ95_LACBS|nr:uncharacterized protein LACBIDRAFT_301973 [Laccaria bicolor S238N-H82]EDR15516.1 predicted protein [Laccaria bicolor S238N-H82]|eukprot:XP_001873724.1 predicted protein [Laccaria bicolor S238N-H82]
MSLGSFDGGSGRAVGCLHQLTFSRCRRLPRIQPVLLPPQRPSTATTPFGQSQQSPVQRTGRESVQKARRRRIGR